MKKVTRCSVWWCWRKVWRFIRLNIDGAIEYIPYCEKHAKIADEALKEGIKTKIPYYYKKIGRASCRERV